MHLLTLLENILKRRREPPADCKPVLTIGKNVEKNRGCAGLFKKRRMKAVARNDNGFFI